MPRSVEACWFSPQEKLHSLFAWRRDDITCGSLHEMSCVSSRATEHFSAAHLHFLLSSLVLRRLFVASFVPSSMTFSAAVIQRFLVVTDFMEELIDLDMKVT